MDDILPKTQKTPPLPKVKPVRVIGRDDITLIDLETLWRELSLLNTIGEWKKRVSDFKDVFNLSDIESINLANKRF